MSTPDSNDLPTPDPINFGIDDLVRQADDVLRGAALLHNLGAAQVDLHTAAYLTAGHMEILSNARAQLVAAGFTEEFIQDTCARIMSRNWGHPSDLTLEHFVAIRNAAVQDMQMRAWAAQQTANVQDPTGDESTEDE